VIEVFGQLNVMDIIQFVVISHGKPMLLETQGIYFFTDALNFWVVDPVIFIVKIAWQRFGMRFFF